MIKVFDLMLFCSMERRQAIDKSITSAIPYPGNNLSSYTVLKFFVLALFPFPFLFPLPVISFSCIIPLWNSAVLGKNRVFFAYPILDFGRDNDCCIASEMKRAPSLAGVLDPVTFPDCYYFTSSLIQPFAFSL